jgi:hypothetical protein
MPQFIGNDGANRVGRRVEAHDGIAQRTIKQGWVGDSSGVARLFFIVVTLNDASYTSAPQTLTANAIFQLNTDGFVYATSGPTSTPTQRYQWVQGATSDYEAFVTVNSGSLSGGAVGSWVSLASLQSWSRSAGANQDLTCTFTVQIRLASGGAVVASAVITLEAIGRST